MVTIDTIAEEVSTLLRVRKFEHAITRPAMRLMVMQSFADLVKSYFAERSALSGPPNGYFYFRFIDVPVFQSTFKLPANPSAGDYGGGVRVYEGFGKEPYLPVRADFQPTSRIVSTAGRLAYFIEGDTGYFIEHPSGLTPPAQVHVSMLAPVLLGADKGFMSIPADFQSMLVDNIMKRIAPVLNTPEDIVNDDTDVRA